MMNGRHIRHGIDLVAVARMKETLERTPGFEARVFTEAERAYCSSQAKPWVNFAARFAAKEAALKALGLGLGAIGISRALRDIETERVGTVPHLVLRGKPKTVAEELGVYDIALSITHTDEQAIASVVMLVAGEEEA